MLSKNGDNIPLRPLLTSLCIVAVSVLIINLFGSWQAPLPSGAV